MPLTSRLEFSAVVLIQDYIVLLIPLGTRVGWLPTHALSSTVIPEQLFSCSIVLDERLEARRVFARLTGLGRRSDISPHAISFRSVDRPRGVHSRSN